jgi:hypothetical protein
LTGESLKVHGFLAETIGLVGLKVSLHGLHECSHPDFNFIYYLDLRDFYYFIVTAFHLFNVVFVDSDAMDASKQLLQMLLDDFWVLRLSQNFQQIIITEEVKATEFVAFFLQIIIECFLA